MRQLRAGVPLLAAVLAVACTAGPNYKRPPVTAPENWRDATTPDLNTLANTPWWDMFGDPQLVALIETALAGNHDLKIAVERITEARARYGFTRADKWPQIQASANAGYLKFSEGTLTHPPSADQPSSGGDDDTPLYNVGVDVSWELDFFGRVRRATEAQYALLLSTEEASRSVTIALVADVARAYFELRDIDRRRTIAERTLESRREYVELARVRFEGGVTPEIDWRQGEAEFERVRTVLLELEGAARIKENELSILLGKNPGPIARGAELDAQPVPAAVPAGLPAELLERRPDLRAAEQELIAANARIGEAAALRWPRISLTGALGLASREVDDLIDGDSTTGFLFGSLIQPIFNAGKNKRRVEVAESRQRQAVYEFERTILDALREVEDGLATYHQTGLQRAAQLTRVGAERRVLELAELRYRGGVADYLEVLDAQRSLFSAELEEVEAVRNHLVALVRLYKALGGGWIEAEQQEEARAPQGQP